MYSDSYLNVDQRSGRHVIENLLDLLLLLLYSQKNHRINHKMAADCIKIILFTYM